jgi:hypothetical protein
MRSASQSAARHRGAQAIALAAGTCAAVALAGCGGAGTTAKHGIPAAVSAAGQAEPGYRGQSGPPAGGRSPVAAAAAPAPLALCRAHAVAAVQRALASAVPGSGTAEVLPLGASADGRQAYVAAWTPKFSGVAVLNLATGGMRKIRAFANPAQDQADGVAAGRWLVWAETYSLSSLDRFTILAWDARTGRLQRIGSSLAAPGGTPWPSPWHAPAVSGNYAAWAQGFGPGGLVEIRLADLATGEVTTIRRGHVQPPFFDRGLVIWPESDTPGTETTLHAYSLAGRRPAALPTVLAAVHGTDQVATDGTRTAYLSPDFTRLYYSPAQDRPAQQVLQLPAGTDFTSLALAPGTLAWSTTRATYLASTRTGAFVQVTREYGFATGSSSVVLITDAPSMKAQRPPLPTHVIDPAGLAWPRCPAVR